MARPKKPKVVDPHSAEHDWILSKLTGGRGGIDALIKAGRNIAVDLNEADGIYTIHSTARGGGAGDAWPPTLYDQTKSYLPGDWIWVKPSSSQVTVGIRDITTGIITQATAGLYRARTGIAPGTVTVSGVQYPAYYIPLIPEPNTDDITATEVKWIYFRGVAAC